jgi:polyketide biosynthesis enoyl-CoA hydratase PksI
MEPVVQCAETEPGIFQITMQDRVNKNTFTPEIVDGLIDAFSKVKESDSCRVVVLTGYDNYFSTGGTLAFLISLTSGEGRFSDSNFYNLALRCEVPVISAMQGHALGGGFVFGLFSDFAVMSRESIYATNFMKYGFTPGMGATFILPKKLGIVLGSEMLMSAKNYYGADLEKRGIPYQVVPRKDVLDLAYELARNISEKPKESLKILKKHLIFDIQSRLPEIILKEEEMHTMTVHLPEVKDRIVNLFGK